jgi:hypothetical protein
MHSGRTAHAIATREALFHDVLGKEVREGGTPEVISEGRGGLALSKGPQTAE